MQIIIEIPNDKVVLVSAAFAAFRGYADSALTPQEKVDALRDWLKFHIRDVVRSHEVALAERQARSQPPIDLP